MVVNIEIPELGKILGNKKFWSIVWQGKEIINYSRTIQHFGARKGNRFEIIVRIRAKPEIIVTAKKVEEFSRQHYLKINKKIRWATKRKYIKNLETKSILIALILFAIGIIVSALAQPLEKGWLITCVLWGLAIILIFATMIFQKRLKL